MTTRGIIGTSNGMVRMPDHADCVMVQIDKGDGWVMATAPYIHLLQSRLQTSATRPRTAWATPRSRPATAKRRARCGLCSTACPTRACSTCQPPVRWQLLTVCAALHGAAARGSHLKLVVLCWLPLACALALTLTRAGSDRIGYPSHEGMCMCSAVANAVTARWTRVTTPLYCCSRTLH